MRPIGSDDNNGVGRFGSKAASEAYSSSILASGCFRGHTSHSPLIARGCFRPEAAVTSQLIRLLFLSIRGVNVTLEVFSIKVSDFCPRVGRKLVYE